MKIQQLLKEAPIQDLDHVVDFAKGSSFRHERDRRIVTHPASISNIKKKFGNTEHKINLSKTKKTPSFREGIDRKTVSPLDKHDK